STARSAKTPAAAASPNRAALPVALGQRHQFDAVLARGQRQLAVLQRQRVIAKDLAPPAVQRPDRRVVGGGDRFEIVGRGDQLLGDLEILAALLQQYAQQLDQGPNAGRRLGL